MATENTESVLSISLRQLFKYWSMKLFRSFRSESCRLLTSLSSSDLDMSEAFLVFALLELRILLDLLYERIRNLKSQICSMRKKFRRFSAK
ncbi:hypothetical protein BpHYR1_009515 [Brachionus plicatilis]|uniref:Uncharacterized protein n=1 Tax=Brachionus plicatilis TaxID=10195 RepID=A0A3M7SU81_BRAPC|nr:hypothetical protein BpHYR1_009515 [Brachionus plicatilis]